MRRSGVLMPFLVIAILILSTTAIGADKATALYGSGANKFSLATGSPGELGLLKVLGEAFGQQENASLDWIKAGSGASLKLLKEKKVDMIMVPAPAAEKKAVQEG